jgi:uncharacterized repeat protein (TIGR01451 family)
MPAFHECVRMVRLMTILRRLGMRPQLRRVSAAAAAILICIGVAVLPMPAPTVAQGTPLVAETFTGATADPRFQAFGSACLTGAEPIGVTPPPPGLHALGGCSGEPVGPAPPTGGDPFGFLQLTDSRRDQTGAVLFNRPIPARQGLEVSFEQWQYGNTAPFPPADGISFFLVDGATDLTAPGQFGGSLGYAQKRPDDDPDEPIRPGVENGYLGIGLDVLGNYFGDWERRGNNCPPGQRSPAGTGPLPFGPGANMVTVRGPGNGTDGYCFLTATTSNFAPDPNPSPGSWPSTLPGQLQGPTPNFPPNVTPQLAAELLEPTRRDVTVRITPAPDPQVTVLIDFDVTDNEGPVEVLQFDAPEPVPATYKLGFAASTGLFTDVHLIRNVAISSAEPLRRLELAKRVAPDQELPPVIPAGTEVRYEFTVNNNGLEDITDLVVNDPRFENIICEDTDVPVGQSVTCTGILVVTQEDVDAGVIVNTAQASGLADGEEVLSNVAQEELPLGTGEAELELRKVARPSIVSSAGQRITFDYEVTNTGQVTIDNLMVEDVSFTGTGTRPVVNCPVDTVPPGRSVVCTGTYEVTQEDIDRGEDIVNTAVATGTDPNENVVRSNEFTARVEVKVKGSLALVKSADPTTVTAPGQTITYTFHVTNNGNVDLTGLEINEIEFSGRGDLSDIVCDETDLAAGEDTTCRATYRVTEADIKAGRITDTATASATSPGGGTVTSNRSSATVKAVAVGALTVVKSADPKVVKAAGEKITYSARVTNSGGVKLRDVTVSEVEFTGSGEPPELICPREAESLRPGDSVTCTGTYKVTEDDVKAGKIRDTVVATGFDPDGEEVTSPPSTFVVKVQAKDKDQDGKDGKDDKGKDGKDGGLLPETGGNLARPLSIGLVLTAIGSLLVLATMRRIRRRP